MFLKRNWLNSCWHVPIFTVESSSDDDPNQGGWVQILPWLILGMFYFLTAGSDPTPETTWSAFYREMLSTGEVLYVYPILKVLSPCFFSSFLFSYIFFFFVESLFMFTRPSIYFKSSFLYMVTPQPLLLHVIETHLPTWDSSSSDISEVHTKSGRSFQDSGYWISWN